MSSLLSTTFSATATTALSFKIWIGTRWRKGLATLIDNGELGLASTLT
jgi:hypothetical protein